MTYQNAPDGQTVGCLLIEETLPIARELYLSLTVDRESERIVVVASGSGGMEIEEIASNPDEPTFENTLVALEKSGQLLTRVTNVFYAVSAANTSDYLQELQEEMASKISANHDAIFLNDRLCGSLGGFKPV